MLGEGGREPRCPCVACVGAALTLARPKKRRGCLRVLLPPRVRLQSSGSGALPSLPPALATHPEHSAGPPREEGCPSECRCHPQARSPPAQGGRSGTEGRPPQVCASWVCDDWFTLFGFQQRPLSTTHSPALFSSRSCPLRPLLCRPLRSHLRSGSSPPDEAASLSHEINLLVFVLIWIFDSFPLLAEAPLIHGPLSRCIVGALGWGLHLIREGAMSGALRGGGCLSIMSVAQERLLGAELCECQGSPHHRA